MFYNWSKYLIALLLSIAFSYQPCLVANVLFTLGPPLSPQTLPTSEYPPLHHSILRSSIFTFFNMANSSKELAQLTFKTIKKSFTSTSYLSFSLTKPFIVEVDASYFTSVQSHSNQMIVVSYAKLHSIRDSLHRISITQCMIRNWTLSSSHSWNDVFTQGSPNVALKWWWTIKTLWHTSSPPTF